jgi:hypothetical protein
MPLLGDDTPIGCLMLSSVCQTVGFGLDGCVILDYHARYVLQS